MNIDLLRQSVNSGAETRCTLFLSIVNFLVFIGNKVDKWLHDSLLYICMYLSFIIALHTFIISIVIFIFELIIIDSKCIASVEKYNQTYLY